MPYPANPLHDSESLALLIVPLIALPVFLVAALSLLRKNSSSLATFASVLVWPYWFLFALGTLDRFFWESPIHRVFYFLGFLSPIVFAFAAGEIPYRSTFAHWMAILAGVWSASWIYLNELRYPELQNAWIMFNVPDKETGMYFGQRVRYVFGLNGASSIPGQKCTMRKKSWAVYEDFVSAGPPK